MSDALAAIQRRAGVKADGAFGPDTAKAIVKLFGLSASQGANFLGQCAHETGGFKLFSENLNYSAQGLRKTFPRYFPTDAIALQYARQPERIANRVYANRMGNGGEETGDGWRYRGRGAIQLTGHDNYSAFAQSWPRVMASPDSVALDLAFDAAKWFFAKNGLFAIADRGVGSDVIELITRRVNGGINGLQDRAQWTGKIHWWLTA